MGSPSIHRVAFTTKYIKHKDFSGGLDSKESACNVGDLVSILGLGRAPGGGHVTHASILVWRIPMDRGAWWAIVHGVIKSWTQLNN